MPIMERVIGKRERVRRDRLVSNALDELTLLLQGGCYSTWGARSRNHARMPHCLQWGGMASLLGGLGDRFPQPNRCLPSKSPAACCGDLYLVDLAISNRPRRGLPTACNLPIWRPLCRSCCPPFDGQQADMDDQTAPLTSKEAVTRP